MPPLKGWLKAAIIAQNTPKHSIIEVLKKKLGGYWKLGVPSLLCAKNGPFCPRE